MNIKTYADSNSLANAFAGDLVDLLKSLIEQQDTVTVALSGGSTPQLLFKILAEKFAGEVNWKKVHFYWGDERSVPPTDAESNFGVANRLLLSRVDIPAANIHRIEGESNPTDEIERYRELILETIERDNSGKPAFDVMMLGIGNDGHTASIFPHQMEFLDSKNVCEIATHPLSGQKRITVTGSVINASRNVFFLVAGDSKSNVLAEIVEQTGSFRSYPASFVAPSGELWFYTDQAAASKLRDNRR